MSYERGDAPTREIGKSAEKMRELQSGQNGPLRQRGQKQRKQKICDSDVSVPKGHLKGVKRDFMRRRCYVWDSDMLRQMSSPVLAS